MRIIVQKFGGTSLVTPPARTKAVEHCRKALQQDALLVVVVSAMGRGGDPYATDTLISLARSVYPDTALREMDLLASCGELISAVIFTNTLKGFQIEALALSGGQAGIITDDNFGDAHILRVQPDHVLRHLNEGKVVVVAGFQGVTENGDITTLGRGGSDTTAVALGAALRAELVEVYTDVEGVKTADPRIVPEARTLEGATYDEITQLAYEGARVIHPRAVEIARRWNVPLRIKSTFSDHPGTLLSYALEGNWPSLENGKVITGITNLPGLTQFRVRVPSEPEGVWPAKVFRWLGNAGVSLDMINVTPDLLVFVVAGEKAEKALHILKDMNLELQIRDECAKVSVVGSGMRGVPGVMARLAEALQAAGVPILQTSDSHLTISCLVDIRDMEKAVRALHQKFGL
ncbi:MAG: aspartate kinase [Firmicutes bacterium]|nr:aspartate kinase [Bacillota bacterium]MCL5040138.1 aspartate kinase [Bacillota bacterium]